MRELNWDPAELEQVAENAMGDIASMTWSKPFTLRPSQVATIKRLARHIAELDFYSTEYEFKQFELTFGNYNTLYLVAVTGRKTDEGTMAAVLCRTRRHLRIGQRGGVQTLSGKKSKCTNYWRTMIYSAEH